MLVPSNSIVGGHPPSIIGSSNALMYPPVSSQMGTHLFCNLPIFLFYYTVLYLFESLHFICIELSYCIEFSQTRIISIIKTTATKKKKNRKIKMLSDFILGPMLTSNYPPPPNVSYMTTPSMLGAHHSGTLRRQREYDSTPPRILSKIDVDPQYYYG